MSYTVTKTYGHEVGLSCAFRQHRAKSHCRYVHGYALRFDFVFGCISLDENGWVLDFGSLKALKAKLEHAFDHTLVIANDDPELARFRELAANGLADLRVVSETGCEAFARQAYLMAWETIVTTHGPDRRAYIISASCSEHGANSATYHADPLLI